MTLIGATTENPYYEVNSALLSRSQVYELESLAPEDLAVVVRRGLEEVGATAADDVVELIVQRAGGDARTALNIVELAAETADGEITEQNVDDAARKRPIVYDKAVGRALRLHVRVHQVDARQRSRRGASTTSRRCSRAARTRASSRGA